MYAFVNNNNGINYEKCTSLFITTYTYMKRLSPCEVAKVSLIHCENFKNHFTDGKYILLY